MSGTRRRVRQALVLSVAAATVTALGIAGATSPVAAKPGTTSKGDVAKARFFAFNDFHGALDPPTGSGGLVNGTPAGGAEYLATELTKLRSDAAAKGQKTLTVAAGDMVGASPLVSAAFHDEPTIEALNLMKLDVTSVGNHEFDEGVAELQRLQNGGCHPTDGCQDGDPFLGASFPYLAANVVDKVTREPIFPPYAIRAVQGVKVGFIGMTLKGTPSIVNPAGITSVDFLDEAETANHYTEVLENQGVHAIVILLHEGGAQSSPPSPIDPSGCANFSGALTGIVANLDPDIDLVVSGHTHRSYVCHLPNSDGQPVLATSAATAGVLVTDISATLSKTTQDFLTLSAQNVIVENGVKLQDGTWQKDASGNFVRNPALRDPEMKTLLDKYRTAIAPIQNRVVGSITSDITNSANANGESALGDVIADAQLDYTVSSANAQIAFMNPGGIRASLIYAASAGGEAPGEITYGETFTVQPFNNLVTTQTFTGQQIKDVLEQQWPGAHRATQIFLQVSNGFTYDYNPSAAFGSHISNMRLNGTPIDLAATYRVTTNDFLANGGDGFTNLKVGTNRVYAPGFDVDALTAYLGAHSPVAPGPQNRFGAVG